MESTLSIIKPDAVAKNVIGKIVDRFESNGLKIAAMKKMRENGEELFEIYHSHPTAAACPSALDLDMANYENTLYFIISLNTKGILELRAFKINNKNALEVPIVLLS